MFRFNAPEIQWFALSPLIVLVGGALALLVVGALTPRWPRGLYGWFTVAVGVAAGVLTACQWRRIGDQGTQGIVADALAWDRFGQFMAFAVLAALVLIALTTSDALRRQDNDNPEVFSLYLVAATGAIVMAAANDLIVLFLGLETMSLAFYILAASEKRRAASQESGLKYFILGGFSSAFFLYGIALIYGTTGSTNLSEMVGNLARAIPLDGKDVMLLAGIAMLLVGLAFKVAAVPFHVWAPDVYEGAPTPMTSFLASIGKIGAFAALVRVLVVALAQYRDDWRPIVWVLAVASILIGSVLAVVQTNVKRMLAYSSVTHAGYILVGVEAAGHLRAGAEGPGIGSVAFYLLTYGVVVAGTFAVVTLVARADDSGTDLDSFRGLAKRRPALAVALSIFLLAQAGVPFTSGFVAKFGVIAAAVEEGSYAIAIIAMLGSVIGAYLYLRIMVSVWMQDDESRAVEAVPFASGLSIGVAALFTVAVGIVPGWLLDAADDAGIWYVLNR